MVHAWLVAWAIIIMAMGTGAIIIYHCKNVRVILTLSGLAQLHLFKGFYAAKM